MVTLDYIILAIILVSAIAGAFRGFLREIFSVIAWGTRHMAGVEIRALAGTETRWRAEGSRLWHLGRACPHPAAGSHRRVLPRRGVVNHFVRLSMFSGLDRLLGFLLGCARGLVIIGIGIILAQATRLDEEAWWKSSRLAASMKPAAAVVRAVAGDHLPPRLAGKG